MGLSPASTPGCVDVHFRGQPRDGSSFIIGHDAIPCLSAVARKRSLCAVSARVDIDRTDKNPCLWELAFQWGRWVRDKARSLYVCFV